MARYWQTLLDNLVFLTCLMPLVGAGLVALSARLGAETIRRTAITNAMLTFSLVVLMVANFDANAIGPPTGPIQMATSWYWLQTKEFHLQAHTNDDGTTEEVLVARSRGPDVRIAVGVDGISLWFLALTATLIVAAAFAARRYDRTNPALCYGSLLVVQAVLMGAFAALDVLLFLICIEFAVLPLLFLIGHYGGYERLRVGQKFILAHLAGTLLVSCGLLATVASHARMRIEPANPLASPTYDARQLIFAGQAAEQDRHVPGLRELVLQNEAALDEWDPLAPWVFLALFAGFAIHAAVVPWHTSFARVGIQSAAPAGLLAWLAGPALGMYGLARFVVPIFRPVPLPILEWVGTFGVLGAICAALLALTQQDPRKAAIYVGVSQTCLATAGLLSFHPAGMAGGILLVVSTALSTTAVTIGSSGRVLNSSTSKWVSIAMVSLIGVPGFGAFVGQFLVLEGLFAGGPFDSGSPLAAAGGLFAVGLAGWSLLRLLQSRVHQTDEAPLRDELTFGERFAVAICLAAALSIGIVPRFVTRPMEQSVAEALILRPLDSTSATDDLRAIIQTAGTTE